MYALLVKERDFSIFLMDLSKRDAKFSSAVFSSLKSIS